MSAAPSANARTAFLVLMVLVSVAAFFQVHNLDLGLHARTGEWILERGEVPTTNVLSKIHTDYPSVHDKWGFQVVSHVLADDLGVHAVIVARWLLMLLMFAVLWRTARGLGANPGMTLLVLSVVLVAARTRFLFRPGLASLVLLALVVHIALVARPDGRRAWWLVPLQVLWVNVHGYFLLGYLTVGAVAFGHLLRGAAGRATAVRFIGWGAAMAAACFLNPSGLDGVLHPFAILTDLRAHEDFYTAVIHEFRPTFAADPRQPYDRLAFFVLGAAGLGMAVWEVLARRRPSASSGTDDDAPTDLLTRVLLPCASLFVLFAVMSPSLRRSMAPFAVVAGPLLAAVATARLGPRVPGLVVPVVLATLVAAGEITDTVSVHDGLDRRWGPGRSEIAYPDQGIAFIGQQLPTAGVFTAFAYGSTFTGERWPDQAAATNGNTHGYPTSWFIEVMAAVSMEDPLAFDRICDRHDLDVALIPMVSPLARRLLRREDWVLVCLGRREAVFVDRGSVAPEWLEEHDLERRLRQGAVPDGDDLPRTPPRGTVLGLPVASPPLTELEAAAMFRGAGVYPAARALAREALEHDPDDAEAQAMVGLLEWDEDPEGSRQLLQRSLEQGGGNRLLPEVRERLQSSG